MKKESIIFDGKVVNLVYKKVKYARLKVSKEAVISMSLPLRYPKKLVFCMLETHKEWINNKVAFIQNNRLKDDKTCLLGKIYTLKFDESIKSVQIRDDEILSPNFAKFSEFKKEFARAKFSEFIDEFLPLIGKSVNHISIKAMSTRWGSCNSTKGYINLSLNLIEKSEDLVRYVVLHELTHLIYPHHQKSFYEFIAKIMPDFKEREKRLKG
ncbi:M48 family metallopeptidase [Campylobacter geochelonis]|uniref:M48 family metallopeptidase n=1 Tax=Campylobacter geochelonis TaxID=1780362 RepID=UPI000770A593|nr:YgjP-like metallopeptidase domain-containing protein [Campylobacter geochelonis]CZE48627.1 zinc metalloprotease [Campylobacter geochelonis]CZE51531.1 zinc metalloprotease [Campylobacter geochelonis]